ncbi:MAG: DUF72 domain-containing protein [Acidobacteriota bacterium]|nr:MAG: DUF72 domain-containing protein [Acidobacteriota bacterium]
MTTTAPSPRVLLGTAGWDHPDWAGIIYPEGRGVDRLRHVARYVDVIEIEQTFFLLPSARSAQQWAENAASNGLQFIVTAPRAMTHETAQESPLFERFRDWLRPLEQAGVLLAVLFRFPQSLPRERRSARQVRDALSAVEGVARVVELRHDSWNDPQVLAWLEGHHVAFANLDQPALPGALPATAWSTSSLAYVGLHGRNRAAWFARLEDPERRSDYLYQLDELRAWHTRVRGLMQQAERVVVIAHNRFKGKALASLVKLRALLGETELYAPAPLLQVDPELTTLAVRPVPVGG